MSPETLLLVDGHNLICKAFFGLPPRFRPDGLPIHGTIGFVSILLKTVKQLGPTHLAVIFDPEETPSRVECYPEYKGNRLDYGNMPDADNPFTQLADVKKILNYLAIYHLELPGYEADDVIASLTNRFNGDTVIFSTDTDFLQLLSHRVNIFSYRGKHSVLIDEAAFTGKYGIPAARYVEYKAMVGDTSDNIEGIRGIGPKTALKVINGVRILDNEENGILRRNIHLITLNPNVPLPCSPEELRLTGSFQGYSVGMLLNLLGIL